MAKAEEQVKKLIPKTYEIPERYFFSEITDFLFILILHDLYHSLSRVEFTVLSTIISQKVILPVIFLRYFLFSNLLLP